MEIGKRNRLEIARQTPQGLYLIDSEEQEVLLPNRYIPEEQTDGWAIGDTVEVFLYMDSEDRLVATTETPKLEVGDVAALEVVASTRIGAFMDWGLPKDLLVPHANQLRPLREGETIMIAAYLDNTTNRIVGTMKLNKLFNNDELTIQVGDKVNIVVAQRRDIGFRVVVNNAHWGMIYDSQIFSEVYLGDKLEAWVTRITEEGRVDLSLQQRGFDQVKVSAEALLKLLEEQDGTIDVGDKSEASDIQIYTGMSKKTFKKAVGYLLAAGKVEAKERSVVLKREVIE